MTLSPIERLQVLMRPPGRGIYIHSTGEEYAAPLLHRLFGTDNAERAQYAWLNTLDRIVDADVLLIGIPSDTGAGIIRGSSFGPIGIRRAYLDQFGGYPANVVDVGDVFCVPQLLHDDMLSKAQLSQIRQSLYPQNRRNLPVSPLSIAELVMKSLKELNSSARVVMLGGDHGVSWPVMKTYRREVGDSFGVLQLDAHTDLSETRLGVKHCFSTWAYHTAQMLKPNRLVQVGLRDKIMEREEWTTLPIVQISDRQVQEDESAALETIVEHFAKNEIGKIYISNDIDATDRRFAPATGTPEPGGLQPDFVKRLLRRVRDDFELIGGDIVEVAPVLSGQSEFEIEPTCVLAAEYLDLLLQHNRVAGATCQLTSGKASAKDEGLGAD